MHSSAESVRFADQHKVGASYLSMSRDYSLGAGDEEGQRSASFDSYQQQEPLHQPPLGLGRLPPTPPSDELDVSKPASPWSTALQFTPDTLIGTLITVAAVLGAGLPVSVALVIAAVHLFADGMSICMAEYLEASAHADHVDTERTTTLEQVELNRDAYVADMVLGYVDKGLSRSDAELVVRTLAKYDEAFADAVLLVEEAVTPAELSSAQGLTPMRSGLIIYACFVAVGSLPLFPLLLAWVAEGVSPAVQCLGSILVSLVLNFFIGVEKGVAEGQPRGNWWTSGFSLTANAMLSGAVAFVIGFMLQPLVQQVYLQAPAIASSIQDAS